MVFTSLVNWIRAAKIAVIVFVCGTMLVVNSSPAFAFGMTRAAEPSQGTAQLDEIYQESKEVIKGQPRGIEDVTNKASQGLNAVQGSADADSMKSAGDSEGATTVKSEIKNALKSATE